MKSLTLMAASVSGLALVPTEAVSAVTPIEVTGVFNAAQDEDEGGLATFAPLLSQPFTLLFSYDSDAADADDDVDNVGTYPHTVPPHQFSLTSGAVEFSDPSYHLSVIGPPNPFSRYFVVSRSLVANVSGLTLPAGVDELSFGLGHEVSDAAVDFLDNAGAGDDPLPTDPFFLGESLDEAFMFVELTTFDAGQNMFFSQALVGTVTSIRVVPEPASAGLVVAGVLVLATRRTGNVS